MKTIKELAKEHEITNPNFLDIGEYRAYDLIYTGSVESDEKTNNLGFIKRVIADELELDFINENYDFDLKWSVLESKEEAEKFDHLVSEAYHDMTAWEEEKNEKMDKDTFLERFRVRLLID